MLCCNNFLTIYVVPFCFNLFSVLSFRIHSGKVRSSSVQQLWPTGSAELQHDSQPSHAGQKVSQDYSSGQVLSLYKSKSWSNASQSMPQLQCHFYEDIVQLWTNNLWKLPSTNCSSESLCDHSKVSSFKILYVILSFVFELCTHSSWVYGLALGTPALSSNSTTCMLGFWWFWNKLKNE